MHDNAYNIMLVVPLTDDVHNRLWGTYGPNSPVGVGALCLAFHFLILPAVMCPAVLLCPSIKREEQLHTLKRPQLSKGCCMWLIYICWSMQRFASSEWVNERWMLYTEVWSGVRGIRRGRQVIPEAVLSGVEEILTSSVEWRRVWHLDLDSTSYRKCWMVAGMLVLTSPAEVNKDVRQCEAFKDWWKPLGHIDLSWLSHLLGVTLGVPVGRQRRVVFAALCTCSEITLLNSAPAIIQTCRCCSGYKEACQRFTRRNDSRPCHCLSCLFFVPTAFV